MRYRCQELLFDATFQKWIQGRLSKWAFRHFKLKSYFGFEFEISAGLITQLGHSWVCYEVYTFSKSVYTSKKSFAGKWISVRLIGGAELLKYILLRNSSMWDPSDKVNHSDVGDVVIMVTESFLLATFFVMLVIFSIY